MICPMRGELEMSIAGTPEESPERVVAIRHAVEKCCSVEGVPFRELLLLDFAAISLHVMALSAGTDEIGTSPGCDKPDCPLKEKQLTLSTLPCVYLRRAEPGEEPSGPEGETDPIMLAAMAVEKAMGEVESGPEIRKLAPADIVEPFEARITPSSNQRFREVVLHWRYHRVKDLEAATEFAAQTGDQSVLIGAALGAFLSARQIVRINGETVGTVTALQWWRKAPSPILRKFRDHVLARDFGYDMRPEFACPRGDCRKKVRIVLPNDGSLFRGDSA